MPALPTSADRAVEFNRLLVEQGHATRSMKYGWQPDDTERQAIDARATRLLELAELLPGTPKGRDPGAYVNERIASWLRANPLALTNHRLVERVRETEKAINSAVGNTCGVSVQIGEGDSAYHYSVMADDLVAVRAGGRVVVRVPESVAEHFRQQGRRELQSEMRALLNVARA